MKKAEEEETTSGNGSGGRAECRYAYGGQDEDRAKGDRSVGHLIVFVHGSKGFSKDWKFVQEALLERLNPSDHTYVFTLSSQANEGKTQEGVLVGAKRLAQEVSEYVISLKAKAEHEGWSHVFPLTLSMLGHSLGGLYIRACLPSLFASCSDSIRLGSYMSFSTPHLGSRRPGGNMKKNLWRMCVHTVLSTSFIFSQTGKELLLEDDPSYSQKLLVQMSDPEGEYMQLLSKFRTRTLFSVAHNDWTVPYTASAIRTFNPYPLPVRKELGTNKFQVLCMTSFAPAHLEAVAARSHSVLQQEVGEAVEEDPFPGESNAIVPTDKEISVEGEAEDEAEEEEKGKEGEDEHEEGTEGEKQEKLELNENEFGEEDLRHYHTDNVKHLEYIPAMVQQLQGLSWRRFDVLFGAKPGPHVHDLWLKKPPLKLPPWANPYSVAGADAFIPLLLDLLLLDLSLYPSVSPS